MPKLVWDQTGEKFYETGVKNGVLYLQNSSGKYVNGVPWNGLTGITESPSGAETTALYADDIKYLNLLSNEEFGATIEAYTYPDEFAICDGSASLGTGVMIGQQNRSTFGLSYKTVLGNDIQSNGYGYKIHLIYGAIASPSEKGYSTINDSPEAITFSWELKTTPVNVTGFKPTATVIIDSTRFKDDDVDKLKALEDILYGIDVADFDTTKTYKVGDYVYHTESDTKKCYKCILAVETAGAWNTSNWEESQEPTARLPLPDEIAGIVGIAG